MEAKVGYDPTTYSLQRNCTSQLCYLALIHVIYLMAGSDGNAPSPSDSKSEMLTFTPQPNTPLLYGKFNRLGEFCQGFFSPVDSLCRRHQRLFKVERDGDWIGMGGNVTRYREHITSLFKMFFIDSRREVPWCLKHLWLPTLNVLPNYSLCWTPEFQ